MTQAKKIQLLKNKFKNGIFDIEAPCPEKNKWQVIAKFKNDKRILMINKDKEKLLDDCLAKFVN